MRKDLIRVKLKEIDEGVRLVEESLPSSFREFENLGLVKDGIYKRVEFCIEDVLDICAVLNSDLELGIPADEEDIVDHLVQADLLSEAVGSIVKGMRGFRNFLVHRYGGVDDKIGFKSIKSGFRDFREFEGEIMRILGSD
ncbi:MAG: DUF86 domain-containing protein [Candidatus Altiarchaeota archaeon]|nr:DUF86 domain-containing protein [Candidatus Altiarchaeota archaeon]